MTDKFEEIIIEKSIDSLIGLLKSPKKVKSEIDYNLLFKDYLNKKYTKLNLLTSIVLKNTQTFLDDIYIPLTLISKNRKTEYKIDKFPSKLTEEYGMVLITDTAGMGKSTIMKKLFLNTIIESIGIPIFIELRRINHDEDILSEIQKELNLTNYQSNNKALEYLIEKGNFIFFFDGFDEIPSENKSNVTKELQKFITKNFHNNKFFLTSRPEVALSSLSEFQEFKIKNLEKKESYELIRKYSKGSSVANLLIEKLEENDMKSIHEFLVNPLLTSLLFLAFEYKQKIPLKKHLFYRQVYDANFENHDLTKGDSYYRKKYCQLQSDDFHRVLRHIGYQCMKVQKIEFEKDIILDFISRSCEFNNDLIFSPSDLLKDLIQTVPLFTKDGNYYKWSHRSIQEYFAAQFIFKDAKDQQSKILERIYNHKDIDYFINTLDLYNDIDYKTFREVIDFNLLNDFKKHTQSCMKHFYENFNLNEYKKRIELIFLQQFYLVQDSRPEINDINLYRWELEHGDEINHTNKEEKILNKLEVNEKLTSKLSKRRENDKTKDSKTKFLSHGILVFPRHGLSTFYISSDSTKLLLLSLLYNKGRNYIRYYERKRDEFVVINLDKKDQDKDIKLNFNEDNPFNKGDNFQLTNNLITNSFPYFMSYDLALEELELITNDKSSNKAELYEF
jgi:hypothetical protein